MSPTRNVSDLPQQLLGNVFAEAEDIPIAILPFDRARVIES
jgi:hypothetical protein